MIDLKDSKAAIKSCAGRLFSRLKLAKKGAGPGEPKASPGVSGQGAAIASGTGTGGKKEKTRKKARKKERRKGRLKYYLEMAGLKNEPSEIMRLLLIGSGTLWLAAVAFICYYILSLYGFNIFFFLYVLIVYGAIALASSFILVWVGFYVYLDLKIYKRKVEIEKVLPDFLQLTASNIKSGMPIDRALWHAIRPRFGVLAFEIEVVAKETITGMDLEEALKRFGDKYDSMTLKRAISLIIEGLKSGGEIGDLLNRISTDIQDSQILRKEMAANLTTYVIFITFATIVAAPFLFGLANQLLVIVQEVTGNIDTPGQSSADIGVSVSASSLTSADFKVFAVLMLGVTSFFSSLIIATIKKGDIKAGLKYIPIFILVTVALFLLSSWGLGKMFQGMF